MKQIHESRNVIYIPDDSVEAQRFGQMHMTSEQEENFILEEVLLFWQDRVKQNHLTRKDIKDHGVFYSLQESNLQNSVIPLL